MKLDLNLNIEQKQELVMTTQLQMSIEILQYSALELKDYIEDEMKENPLLEMMESQRDMNYRESSFNSVQKQDIEYENFVAYQPDFCEYLENQLFEVLSDDEIELGKFIVGSLNESGELTTDLEMIAEIFAAEGFNKEEIAEVYQRIQKLDINYDSSFASCKAEYIDPDLIVKKEDGKFYIEEKNTAYPTVTISSYYYNLLKNQDDDMISDYLKEKYQAAVWLIKSIEQRKNTIRKIAQAILKKQMDFFENGLKNLKVLTMEEVAEEIEMHESTVSRATTAKYLQTPHGVFSLKFFFNSGIDGVSSVSIKAMLSEEIEAEDSSHPLSDSKLAEIFAKKYELDISRRTVAKYRKSLGIKSSRQRKKK
ncbi:MULTISPECIES: RNA polymerase factor sigma-54 [Halanaerobium]|jgi:RNA polymerase sigma-54 factor|uniref:RNA polymerase sigma-54 factor n=1 Tax=Halanaerobium congolense TaxID=54121 RepID=A0A1M7NUU1_9FIRM|nr:MULTISPECIES: RNA polymerase subunit sigma-54 [Halanaerobium]KXS49555.1 MAG: RNA polymerase sigma-54 factor [Halanaerobium sp. T82-1]PUU89230.1 MAG: RNA polymerase sigma-54 factor [Halanaerobium sp.]PUU92009.1 MAG: RNA polymerase sigma-54 factor [Halanaerobium sp.]TDP12293.1 RNA polymerase sigma-54 factor [Halanaerobium congolense]TDS23818.1 RNA polymerase sigma-54 factor [Halanaerobium congolense]